MVTIEGSEDERSIVTPDLRLRFRWVGDRWTHGIDIRPGPWRTLVEAIEWSPEGPDRTARPTYQELHLQEDGSEVVALLLGQAGPHHYSASFRVRFRADQPSHRDTISIVQDRSESLVEIDVADRCRSPGPLEAHYLARQPPSVPHRGDSNEAKSPGGGLRDWRPQLVWEADGAGNGDVTLGGMAMPSTARVAIVNRSDSGDWHVRVAPNQEVSAGTRRFGYFWAHRRMHAHP